MDDPDLENLNVYALFKQEYGFDKKDVDELDAKLVWKVLIFHKVINELSNTKKVERL